MNENEKVKVNELVKTNFHSKRKPINKGISECGSNCSGCTCPGGDLGAGGVSISLEAVGYAGGYAGDLSVNY